LFTVPGPMDILQLENSTLLPRPPYSHNPPFITL
jgi:hypothetical protein